MSVTFRVDDVVPASERAATVPLGELVGDCAFLGAGTDVPVLDDNSMHPLIGAVHHAFVDHRALVLSPDAVWLTIAQGVAQHVRVHANEMRSKLVQHSGKRTLEITVDAVPIRWDAVITEFRQALGNAVGEGRARLLTCNFSTTTDAERIASEIVFMDVMSAYFDFSVSIICGIPSITLLGTVEDWREIRTRIDVIAELGLETWARSLASIADRFIAAASGHADVAFFQRIYKPQKAYGWDRVTGWIARLYPYIQSTRGDYSKPNPLLALPIDHEEPETEEGYFNGIGIRTCDPPPGAARVLVRCTRPDGSVEPVTFEGGLLGIEQTATGALAPRAGYVVRATQPIDHVIDQLHSVTNAGPSDGEAWVHDAQLHALFSTIGSASIALSSATWRLVPAAERSRILVASGLTLKLAATRVIDLGDGSILAVIEDGHVVRLGQLTPSSDEDHAFTTADRLEAIPVIAASLIELLARALRSDVDLRSTTSLLDVSPEWWDTPYHAAPLLDRLRAEGKIVDAPHGEGFVGVAEVRVGTSTWKKFVVPAAWTAGSYFNSIVVGMERARPMFDLGDGTVLAAIERSRIVRLDQASIVAEPVSGKKKRFSVVAKQVSIPVLGRTMVDVLTFAAEHGHLPRPA